MTTIDEPRPIRERVVRAAIDFTISHGWAALTMAKLADRAGVSRQTVYNELGGKPQLAEAMVFTELAHFLQLVESAFDEYPDDIVAAIEEAALRALELGERNPLLRAILSARTGADQDLLPLLTTHSEPLLDAAREMITTRVLTYDLPIEHERLRALIDMVVRLVLSHVMQPGGTPSETAATIAWMARRVLIGEHPAAT